MTGATWGCIPQQLASDPLHGRAKIAAIYVKVFVIDDDNLSSSLAGGANMGPCAPPAPAQEHRAPTIGAALLPTGSGQAPTRLLSYDAVKVGRAQTRPCRGATTEGAPARKSMSVAYRREYKKAYSAQDEGMAPLMSIEHSLMDPEREKEEHKMHNSMCCWKLTCLFCSCDRDFQSNYRRRTSMKTNVSFNKTQI